MTEPPPFLALACRRATVLRSLKVAAVVGTVLVLINHGDALFRREIPLGRLLRMGLTYLVPYCVATYAAVDAQRSQARR